MQAMSKQIMSCIPCRIDDSLVEVLSTQLQQLDSSNRIPGPHQHELVSFLSLLMNAQSRTNSELLWHPFAMR